MCFQRVDATTYFTLVVLGFLYQTFPDRAIGRAFTKFPSPLPSTPRIPDMTTHTTACEE